MYKIGDVIQSNYSKIYIVSDKNEEGFFRFNLFGLNISENYPVPEGFVKDFIKIGHVKIEPFNSIDRHTPKSSDNENNICNIINKYPLLKPFADIQHKSEPKDLEWKLI